MNRSNSPYKGSGALTRAQFLFYEMRTTAKLMADGLSDEEIIERIASDNLFQFPTEKSVKQITRDCLKNLHALNNHTLVEALVTSDSVTAKQIYLYAMMKTYRLVWDFMITVIGEKYRQQDYSYHRRDIIVFLMRLQEQDDDVATWSESTCKKIASVLSRLLIENEYIDNGRSTVLNTVLISRILENEIRESGQEIALAAFNCLA